MAELTRVTAARPRVITRGPRVLLVLLIARILHTHTSKSLRHDPAHSTDLPIHISPINNLQVETHKQKQTRSEPKIPSPNR